MTTYAVAGSRPWNRQTFERRLEDLPGTWLFVATPDELDAALAAHPELDTVFFLHWSHKVTADVLSRVRCINFHMTDLPYGRGGSPLQNLIARGHDHTKLTAIRMTPAFDEGAVYAKRDLCLEGTAEEVYLRAGELSAEVIAELVADWPEPVEQTGEVVRFKRRTPGQSAIADLAGLDALHDFIRMLDADGYPRAFLEHAGFRFEFRRSGRYEGRVEASVTITEIGDGS